jgi:tetratricopeptide (TPR) repeat protein
MAFLQLGEPKRAREACNQALLIDPGNRSARYTLGCALLEEGNPSEALRVFKEALEENPDHMEAYLELCRVRRVSKDNVWLSKALKAELTAYDKAPLESGLKTPRSVTRQRVEILLDQLRAAGPSMLPTLVEGLSVSQTRASASASGSRPVSSPPPPWLKRSASPCVSRARPSARTLAAAPWPPPPPCLSPCSPGASP